MVGLAPTLVISIYFLKYKRQDIREVIDIKEYKTTEAQRRAVKNYNSRNKDKKRIDSYKSSARTFVRHHATREDLNELIEIFEKENPNK